METSRKSSYLIRTRVSLEPLKEESSADTIDFKKRESFLERRKTIDLNEFPKGFQAPKQQESESEEESEENEDDSQKNHWLIQ